VGYLLKGSSVDEIVDAIKRAPEGRGSLSIELTGDIIQELAGQLSAGTRMRNKRQTFERRIRRALENSRALAMVFQPIVGLRDGETVGAEALARFAGPPERAPSLWFAEAEAVGLGGELELLAVHKAIDALPLLPHRAYLTLNVSPTTLTNAGFLKLVSNADGSRLVAEITEHAQIEDYARLSEALTTLRALGMRLAIDDAGAGYSSLRHILELKPRPDQARRNPDPRHQPRPLQTGAGSRPDLVRRQNRLVDRRRRNRTSSGGQNARGARGQPRPGLLPGQTRTAPASEPHEPTPERHGRPDTRLNRIARLSRSRSSRFHPGSGAPELGRRRFGC
jgi:hypothetical protein